MEGPRYRMLERLGQGGMATVWRAEDRQLGRDVAVKVLLPLFADRPAAQERFFREARALATIRHPNVLQLFDFLPATQDEPARLVMERLQGPSLQRFVVDAGAPLPELAALVGAEIGAGLVAVHARGIVHRDVKPENVLLDEGRVVLTDFGVARVQTLDAALTQTGDIIGSPAYMSPEQTRGDAVDQASDQFSLGSLLYWLASGRAPFSGPHPLVVMQKIERVEVMPLGSCNPRVPAWLDRVVRRCHARAPADRYPDMAALVAALRTGLSDDGFGEPAVELRAYFAAPPTWNESVAARVVPARLGDAERALLEGRRARALVSAERVLQLDPDQLRAQMIVSKLTTGRSRVLLVAGVVAALVVAGIPLALRARHVVPRVAVSPPVVADKPPMREPVVAMVTVPAAPRITSPPIKKPHVKQTAPIVELSRPTPVAVVAAPPAPAMLTVRTSPWCDLTVDGKAAGRTPQALALPAGEHRLRCTNPSGGLLERTVALSAGATKDVEARLDAQTLVTSHLVRGDTVSIDDQPVHGSLRITAGRHRVSLQRASVVIDTRWLDVPQTGCALFDQPELRCERP